MADLRVIADETPALALDELRSHGNALLADARRAAMEALRAATAVDLFRTGGFTPTQVKLLHRQAKDAVTAWSRVETMLGELVHEFDKSRITALKSPR
ncbi:hypothetical protein [Mycobacteroides abscessus]|uniref:hypothetical protein n=1 Tax=Mycobacteroides abscessus TaxID=36809 RepID=UPI00210712AC|nr:hypothetical protein [Mycobacteroides abscessus]